MYNDDYFHLSKFTELFSHTNIHGLATPLIVRWPCPTDTTTALLYIPLLSHAGSIGTSSCYCWTMWKKLTYSATAQLMRKTSTELILKTLCYSFKCYSVVSNLFFSWIARYSVPSKCCSDIVQLCQFIQLCCKLLHIKSLSPVLKPCSDVWWKVSLSWKN